MNRRHHFGAPARTGPCLSGSDLPHHKPAATPAAASSAGPVVEIGTITEQLENPMAHNDESATTLVTDPVCGMKIDPKTAFATREHDGTTFYFCSQRCVDTFDADPHRYGHPHATH